MLLSARDGCADPTACAFCSMGAVFPRQLGFPDDGYDYLQHCRTIGASGGAGAVFVPVTVKPVLQDDQRVYDARDSAKATAVAPVRLPLSTKPQHKWPPRATPADATNVCVPASRSLWRTPPKWRATRSWRLSLPPWTRRGH